MTSILLDKVLISFNKASKSYDKVATLQKDAAVFLTSKILTQPNFTPKTFLDLGTGTGYMPEIMLPKFRECFFDLNDIAHEMLAVCKAKFAKANNIRYLPGDMLSLNNDIYDCVTSNLALQWLNNLQHGLKFLHSKSSKVFAFSTLLDGTFVEWENIINQYQPIKILYYPKAEKIIDVCKKLKTAHQTFEFWLKDALLSFTNASAFMRYLKLLGASNPVNIINTSNLKKILKTHTNSLTITYKIFFGLFKQAN
jgi:malonyl-CoA O-methyltransferase